MNISFFKAFCNIFQGLLNATWSYYYIIIIIAAIIGIIIILLLSGIIIDISLGLCD